jgi:hypothetical protein
MTSLRLSFALLGFLCVGPISAQFLGSIGAQFLGPVGAQNIGTDQCACFPSIYTIELNLGQTCTQTSLPSSGIESTACSVVSESGVVSGMVPVSVSEITVFELGQNLGTIITEPIAGGIFTTGTQFFYLSTSVGTQEGLNATIASGVFPRGLELHLRGLNLYGEIIINRVTIVFSNECDVFPVVQGGDQIGWVKFVSISSLSDVRA